MGYWISGMNQYTQTQRLASSNKPLSFGKPAVKFQVTFIECKLLLSIERSGRVKAEVKLESKMQVH